MTTGTTRNKQYLPIKIYGNQILERAAKPVTEFDTPFLRTLMGAMFDTMYAAEGIGLAANQVGVDLSLFVMDVTSNQDPEQRRLFINPTLHYVQGPQVENFEGCLSFPGVKEKKLRFPAITVVAYDLQGQPFSYRAEELEARCIQHEMDHLQGVHLATGLSNLKRDLIRRKVTKYFPLGGERVVKLK